MKKLLAALTLAAFTMVVYAEPPAPTKEETKKVEKTKKPKKEKKEEKK